MRADQAPLELNAVDRARSIMSTLAEEVGPRRPTSRAERLAAELLRDELRAAGVDDARLEPFAAYSTFAGPYGVLPALSLAATLLPRSWRARRAICAAAVLALLATEDGLVRTPVSDLFKRRESRNVVGAIEPRNRVARTLCLVAHVDSSRSGLLFHPLLAPYLRPVLLLQGLATAGAAVAPLVERLRVSRWLPRAARAISAVNLALLAERELRGEDVPGANDNASGAGAVVQLAAEYAATPPQSTRLVVVITGAEEAGLLGMQAFLREHDTDGWIFLNVDGVAAPATLRHLKEEGMGRRWRADPALVALCERQRGLGLEPADKPLGLTYDATAVLARGGRAITLVSGDGGRIPNYHQPSDTVDNADVATLARALACVRELVAAIDRGEADR